MRSYDQLLVDLHEAVRAYDVTGNENSFMRNLLKDSSVAIEELWNKVSAYEAERKEPDIYGRKLY